MWSQGKKSIGVRSGDMGGQAIGPSPPIQRLLSGSEMLILKRISFPLSLRQQQPGIFEHTHQSLLRCWLCIEVDGCTLNICSILVRNTTFFFSEYFSSFAWIPTLVRPNMTVCSTARMHLWHSSLTIKLCFCPPYHLTKFWHCVFLHPV